MIVVRTVDDLRQRIRSARSTASKIGFVPTMGFLHEGHLSLVDAARSAGADYIVVSIFVNPTQFGPREDFASYPRDEDRDRRLLEERGADLLFAPDVATMYPEGSRTTVRVAGVSEPLEGARRPGHFDGVSTVVAKLLNMVTPDLAVFGQKDAQQCAVIRRMVLDLELPLQLLFAPTIREKDGLAMSSRNWYLSENERVLAPALHRALLAGAEVLGSGAADAAVAENMMVLTLEEWPGVTLDYLAVVDPETFLPPEDLHRPLVVVGAVRIGTTRLIDNIPLPRGFTKEQGKDNPLQTATA
ncbi:MAG: pantoate--beta-alanine ligase [Acidobacteriota bacterium]